jgi:hypothetical protein
VKDNNKLMAYHTGLFAADYSRFPRPPYRGNGWHANLIATDSEFSIGQMRISGKTYTAKEVVIRAKKDDKAQRAANLIHAARLVLNASNVLSHIYPGEHAPIWPLEKNDRLGSAVDESENVTHPHVMAVNIPLACLIAASASWRLQYVYGLAKLRLSLETFSLPTIELDPYHSDNVPKSLLSRRPRKIGIRNCYRLFMY